MYCSIIKLSLGKGIMSEEWYVHSLGRIIHDNSHCSVWWVFLSESLPIHTSFRIAAAIILSSIPSGNDASFSPGIIGKEKSRVLCFHLNGTLTELYSGSTRIVWVLVNRNAHYFALDATTSRPWLG